MRLLYRYLKQPISPEQTGNLKLTDIPVVKEQLFSRLNGSLGKDADPMVAVHHHNLRVAVGVDGMVGEPYLVTLARRIHYEVYRPKQFFLINYNSELFKLKIFISP